VDVQLKKDAEKMYFILGGVFIAALVACNLTFQKFFFWEPFTFLDFGSSENSSWYNITHYRFEISVGIIPYPVTFLITDIVSEIYGRRRSDLIVLVGLIASAFVLLIVWISGMVPATDFSPVTDDQFHHVFGSTIYSVGASMAAYLTAQFVDIRLFHFWKVKTNGKHLWLRNNFSTIPSQFLDTLVVLLVLCYFEAIPWTLFGPLLINGFLFKVILALFDTPFFYFFAWYFRKKFKLGPNEEIDF